MVASSSKLNRDILCVDAKKITLFKFVCLVFYFSKRERERDREREREREREKRLNQH